MKSPDRVRVLYVEDDRDAYEMMETLLGFSEIDVVSANDIENALDQTESGIFDLYLLDNRLPDGTGTDLCNQLRAVDTKTPIVFYSGDAGKTSMDSGLKAGANVYVTKPHLDCLAETIHQLVRESRVAAVPFRSTSRTRFASIPA
jgi:two-component system phosphate regulon response regulator PhoB